MGGYFSRSFDPVRDLPDLSGKVFIVTGANTGIGYSTVKHLARHGAKVYLGARNESKAIGAIASLEAEGLGPGYGKVIWLKLDLSEPRVAKRDAEAFLTKEKRLDVLINNAAMLPGPATKSHDGILDSIMVNHIGSFVVTRTLLPLLKETAREPGSDVRIINLSSDAYRMLPKDVRFQSKEDFNRMYESAVWPGFMRYATSKLAIILVTRELQKRLTSEGSPIFTLLVHPGSVHTSTTHNLPFPIFTRWLFSKLFLSADVGSLTSAFASASSSVRENPEKYKGAYLRPVAKIVELSGLATSQELTAELLETTEKFLQEIGV